MVSKENTMDDQFLYSAWRKPRPELVARIRGRLAQQDQQRPAAYSPRPMLRAAAYVAATVLTAGAFALPPVRAGAAAFLDLFRVVNFAPIPIQSGRLRELGTRGDLDLPRLLGEQVEVLKDPGAPREFADAAATAAAAGLPVRMPLWLPYGMRAHGFEVHGESETRITLNTRKLQGILDILGIDDVRMPTGVDGKSATLNVPRVAVTRFQDSYKRTVTLWQARQPVALLPSGVDIPGLAEVGLRILGVDSNQASSIARSVDWRTTLLVPVPADVSVFREILVQGNSGVLIEIRRPQEPGTEPAPTAQLMWSAGGMLYVMVGSIRPQELVAMAQSLQ
jgi:hypothetical protein